MTGVVLKHALSERGNDLYQTPKVAVEALLRVERLPPQLWDPCSAAAATSSTCCAPTVTRSSAGPGRLWTTRFFLRP